MKIGDLVRAIPKKHPAGVTGVIIDTWWHPHGSQNGFYVLFPGTAHRSDSHTDMHVKYAGDLEVIN